MVKAEGDAAASQGLSQGAIAKLITLLVEERQLSGTEIAETLWLALQMDPAVKTVAETPLEKASESPSPTPTSVPAHPSEEDEKNDEAPPTRANVATAAPQAGVLPTKALPVWIADPPMLSDPLAVMRALKPLLRQVKAGTGKRLDEAATVEGIARTQLWLPVLEAETEPWFDIVLIVDRSSSMHLWRRLVADLEQIFRRYGAFRDLQVFDLAVDAEKSADAVRLKSHPSRPGHHPSELIEQRGRRIAIVLSDCAATYWWDGKLLPMLRGWADVMPTVVWQMLPEWMWERTALGRGKSVSLGNGTPGAANHRLQRIVQGHEGLTAAEQKRLPVPVITSEPDDLKNWSRMLAGDRQELTPGYLLPQVGGRVPKAQSLEALASERVSREGGAADDNAAHEAQMESLAATRVERFLQLSSPLARRLVMLLAAAPVITLPVMRLIRDAMLSDGTPEGRSPLPVAEVFLSGLLQRLPEQDSAKLAAEAVAEAVAETAAEAVAEFGPEASSPKDEQSLDNEHYNDLVQYDFVPKVRKLLLKLLPKVETLEVVTSVSAAVEERWNRHSPHQAFRAFLTDPQATAPEGLAGMRSFASVTAEILEPLGGEYAAFAEELRQGAAGIPEEETAEIEDDFEIPPLRILEFFHSEVREEIPPVQLVMKEFTVATVEFEEAVEDEGAELNVFEFEVTSLIAQKEGWGVQREPGSAYQFVEVLGEGARLEMVAIPAGTFTMGSPENEPERYDDEAPQHEVMLKSFFMGRYPVTQAQWRFVAGLEQVERELEPDPSGFKGDDRPVERVSWYEAVEFCARLSRYTGNEYTLPSEAQWEYACRAGTQSPFNFGDTISSELANYIGTTVYNGGPKGENRGETTSVDYFDAANAFGLCDMHGNVWEWCADHWHENYEGKPPTDGSAWLTDNERSNRVRRGGSWFSIPRLCRSATRDFNRPDDRPYLIGFRVCCLAPRTLQPPTS